MGWNPSDAIPAGDTGLCGRCSWGATLRGERQALLFREGHPRFCDASRFGKRPV